MARRFITPKTLETALSAVQSSIDAADKGPHLAELYLAEKELTEAITAAAEEPEPAEPKKTRKRRTPKTTEPQQPEA